MKRPLLDEMERRIMREYPRSFSGERLLWVLAVAHLKRGIEEDVLEPLANWLSKKLN